MSKSIFYQEAPLFGFDIGFNSIKLMQINTSGKTDIVEGYGFASFDSRYIDKGAVVNPKAIAKEVYDLINMNMVGKISTKRVAVSVPAARTFIRPLSLPKMSDEDLKQAVLTDAEQYIPMQVDDLYIDYEIVDQGKETEVVVVATPKKVVDSYYKLFDLLDLEVGMIETSISASTRLVMHAERTDVPTLIIDFGSVSTDLSVFDTVFRIAGTVSEGGDQMTKSLSQGLAITQRQAEALKSQSGLAPGKRQKQILETISPILTRMLGEIKKIIKFYEERSEQKRKLEQIVILGGGANMPGLADYLTDHLRLPVRMCNPWLNLDFKKLQPPHQSEKTIYATAAGLALVKPEDIHD